MEELGDPLSQFRRDQISGRVDGQGSNISKGSTAKRAYEAYDKKGRPCTYTEILCTTQPSQSPQSRFFMAAIFSADYDNAFTALYSFMAVEVRGRNLKEIRRAIQHGRCEFIQEYHENEFLPPGKDDPVIESIRFVAGERLEDILAGHKEGRQNAG